MMTALLVFLGGLAAAPASGALENAMPIEATGAWTVMVGPGTVRVGGRVITLEASHALEVAPLARVNVAGERYDSLPLFDVKAGGWRRGAQLRGLVTQECTATGLLDVESVRVRSATAPGFAADKDYIVDPDWATLGRVEGGAIAAGAPVWVDYAYEPCRLDSIVVRETGEVKLLEGTPGVGALLPPPPESGETVVAHVWVPGRTEALSEEHLYPIAFAAEADPEESVAARLLPKTLAKLRAGEPVLVVAWGDSVTNGGGVGGEQSQWYQEQFVVLLRERFPQAEIALRTAAWGGSNSRQYMDEPPGGTYDFQRDVLDPQPDLVVIEFVNDAYLSGDALNAQYTLILDRLHSIGAEVAVLTPHLIRPDWMGVSTLKFDSDPRPYVRDLRIFASEHQAALADASAHWCRLWRRGIPYVTLLANSINHPDVRGHALFARALMELFPAK